MKKGRILSGVFAAGSLATGFQFQAVDAETVRPNILWLTSEDNNVNWIGCYGNPEAETPNIDRLAGEGFRYLNVFANAPVCAPSRSTWITGMHAVGLGTHPMRSRHEIPHDRIRYYPDFLRQAGVFCGNFNKTDYNIGGRPDPQCWDNAKRPDWNQLKNRQPFFQVINLAESHESRAFRSLPETLHDPAQVTLRSYHPDLPDIRANYAKYYDAVKRMDDDFGKTLQDLEAAGLAENTIVVYCSDHGGVMPRSKRFLFDSGTHCPLIIRIPEKWKAWWPAERPGMTVDRLVSFIDMPKTWLSLTGTEIPEQMQGTVFLGPEAEPEPEFHFAFRGRMDERIDNERAVRDRRFLYIKNYMPYVPRGQYLEYQWKLKAMQAWERYYLDGKADEITGRYFRPKAESEELYDCLTDPDNVHNLIHQPEHAGRIEKMRSAMRAWQEEIRDAGLLPESEMVRRATAAACTIYEVAQDSGRYDLSAYLDAADLALAGREENLPALQNLMSSPDSGLRYWGVAGCFMLNTGATPAAAAVRNLLEDESHDVRILAAWTLIRIGEKEAGWACLETLLRTRTYAMESLLNVLDWMGADAQRLMPAVRELPEDKGSLREYLLKKYA